MACRKTDHSSILNTSTRGFEDNRTYFVAIMNLHETREALSAACPDWIADVLRPLRARCRAFFLSSNYMESTFSQIYEKKSWGDGESVSGPGSDLDQTAAIREALPKLLREIGARSMVDAPCGDFFTG